MKVKIDRNPPGYTPSEEEFKLIYPKFIKEWKMEEWEEGFKYEDFKKDFLAYLNEEHCGDCVCVPASCMRCLAEELFEIPFSKNWCRCYFYIHNINKCKKHQNIWVK